MWTVHAGGNAQENVPAGAPPLAGRSLASAFQKDGTAPHEFIYFNHNNNRAIRVGDWKLIATGTEGTWELYDLTKDRGELKNLASAQPDRAKKLSDLWKQKDDEYARVREAAPPTGRLRMPAAGGGKKKV